MSNCYDAIMLNTQIVTNNLVKQFDYDTRRNKAYRLYKAAADAAYDLKQNNANERYNYYTNMYASGFYIQQNYPNVPSYILNELRITDTFYADNIVYNGEIGSCLSGTGVACLNQSGPTTKCCACNKRHMCWPSFGNCNWDVNLNSDTACDSKLQVNMFQKYIDQFISNDINTFNQKIDANVAYLKSTWENIQNTLPVYQTPISIKCCQSIDLTILNARDVTIDNTTQECVKI